MASRYPMKTAMATSPRNAATNVAMALAAVTGATIPRVVRVAPDW